MLEELPTFQVQVAVFAAFHQVGHDVDPIILIARNKFLMIM